MNISKTEQKRQARELEELAQELTALAPAELKLIPADELLKTAIKETQGLKAGARKRQIKYIAKALRQSDPEPLLVFLARRKGSRLRANREFHELERLRDAIIDEAIGAHRRSMAEGLPFQEQEWRGEVIREAAATWPDLDTDAVYRAAAKFAVTRKPVYKKEIFRQLKTAMERGGT